MTATQLPLFWRATDAERDAYAELDELAAQWKALSEWDRLERRRAEYRNAGTPRTCTVTVGTPWITGGGPGGYAIVSTSVQSPEDDDAPPSTLRSPPPSEEPFPLTAERRARPKRPSWFDLALPEFLSSFGERRRSSGHADDDPPELPRPRLRISTRDRR